MCKGVTQGTYCDSEEEHCNCVKSFFFYLDEEICKSKLPYGENCTQIDACVDEVDTDVKFTLSEGHNPLTTVSELITESSVLYLLNDIVIN